MKYSSDSSSSSGSYLLIIKNTHLQTESIGSLGLRKFQAGYYGYVGSAMNHHLLNRVTRHLKPSTEKRKHWHIDYFLDLESTHVMKIILFPSNAKEECKIAHQIKKIAVNDINQFGASDCKCNSHLFYFGSEMPFNSKIYQNLDKKEKIE